MRIKQISVNGLFGIFDHVIPLKHDENERITIIHGPNGFGKTAILRLLNGFFNSQYSELKKIPFEEFKIELDNNEIIEIAKNSNKANKKEKIEINFYLHKPGSEKVSFPLKRIKFSPSELGFPVSILDELIPDLEQIGSQKWLYLPTQQRLSLEEVIEQFGDSLPKRFRSSYSRGTEPQWLADIKNSINIRLIESQRLLNLVPNNSSVIYRRPPSILSTVSAYSDELATLMQDKFKEYGTTSQSLDRTFPLRVVKQQRSVDLTDEELRQQLNELELNRSRLIEVGLLDKEEEAEFQIQPQDIDESTKNALSVYVQDVEKKLNVFAETAKKIDLLRKVINKKFAYSYKEISFSKDKGFIFTTLYKNLSTDTKQLLPTDLSSGEQHELVLLYELLFKVQSNSLVMIDEPELSLHVGWQTQFLEDLKEITQLADLDILMATHSPDIIQDRWDLTVELKRPE